MLGRGHTQEAGGAHAEVMALRDAAARGADVRGATVVVTLEPCSHHGRTPPCADALIAAGVGRVVVAMRDPNPLVAGRGAARLAAAGIAVVDGPCGDEARDLNIGFVSRMERGRPWLRLKTPSRSTAAPRSTTAPASGSPASRPAPTATPGASAPAPC